MAMSKKDFIALADALRDYNRCPHDQTYNQSQLAHLADFCASQNPRFMRERWLGYIRGECGSNGGQIKPEKPKRVRRGAIIEGLDYIDEHGAIRTRKVGA